MHVLSQRSLARGRPSYSKVVDLRDLWEESLLLGSHAKNMKSRLEVDERRELPSAICSENGPFDVTHRQNFWRSANVRGWVGRHPRKEFPDLSIHGMEILVERIFRAFSTFVLINSRSTINRVARRIINELASSERLLVPSTWVGKQSSNLGESGNLRAQGSIEIGQLVPTTGLLAFASGYEIFCWTGANGGIPVVEISAQLPPRYYRRREYASREFRMHFARKRYRPFPSRNRSNEFERRFFPSFGEE